MGTFLKVIGGSFAVYFLALLLSICLFVLGGFIGWSFASVIPFFGQWIINGMALFGMELTMAQLPLFMATLGFIAAQFKNTSTSK